MKKGFYFLDAIPVAQGICDNNRQTSSERSDTDKVFERIIDSLSFSLGDIYFLERKEGLEIQNEYRMIIGTPGWGKKPTNELQTSLDDLVKQGFRPVAVSSHKIINRYALSILVEKKGESISNGIIPQYQIIRSEFGFEKKVNQTAKQGFRLVFAGEMGAFKHAVMLKETKEMNPLTYNWVDSTSKTYPVKLSELANKGADLKFVTSHIWGCDYSESSLVFEQTGIKSIKPIKFKTLNLTDKMKRNITIGEKVDDFLSPSEERMQEFRKLIKEGYIIRDLFYAEGVNVLLEHPK